MTDRTWTPTTEQVRAGYASDPEAEYRDPVGYPAYERGLEEAFDRWLEEHDHQVAQDTLTEHAWEMDEREA